MRFCLLTMTTMDNVIREEQRTESIDSTVRDTEAGTQLPPARTAPQGECPLHQSRPNCSSRSPSAVLIKKLSLTDKLLTPAILLAMIVGVIIGEFVPGVQPAFDTARFASVSARMYTTSLERSHARALMPYFHTIQR